MLLHLKNLVRNDNEIMYMNIYHMQVYLYSVYIYIYEYISLYIIQCIVVIQHVREKVYITSSHRRIKIYTYI